MKMPDSWKQAELGSVAISMYGGGTPSTKIPELWSGTLPWITSRKLGPALYLNSGEKYISEQALQTSATQLVPTNSLIVATRVGVGKVGITGIDLAINQDLAGVIVDPQQIDLAFLAYQMMSDSIQQEILAHRRGATIQGITRDDLRRLHLMLPPLDEQRKIAAVLSLVQRAIEHQQRLIALTTELKKALMHKLFTEGLHGEPQKETEIGPIPASWSHVLLGDIAHGNTGAIQTGPFGSQLHKHDYQLSGVGVINPTHLANRKIVHDDVPFISETKASDLERPRLKAGDVLFARRGEIGRHGLVSTAEEGWLCGTGCFLVRIRHADFDNRFLSFFFSTKGVVSWLEGHAAGAIMPNLSNRVLRSIPVFFPSLEDQKEIADTLDAIDSQIDIAGRMVSNLTGLFRTLLHQLMAAQIRVDNLELPELQDVVDADSFGAASTVSSGVAGESAGTTERSSNELAYAVTGEQR